MERNNTIGIVGRIGARPELIVEAADWERELYETTLTRKRPSGAEDTYILQFDGRAAGSKELLGEIAEGVEVLIGGEIRSENVYNPRPEEKRVKIYIYAEVIVVNDPPAADQNEVTICGHICRPPSFWILRRGIRREKKRAVTNIMVAVKSGSVTNYIPCVFFDSHAFQAKTLKTGDHVEVYGRFHSRDYKKRFEGKRLPFLFTAYEVCVVRLKEAHP